MFGYIKNIHFVGIGGIGMSGIAEVLLTLGYNVSGSDLSSTHITDRLKSLGAHIYHEHAKNHLKDVQVIVVSSAVATNNPEIEQARLAKIPIIHRSEMLSELMRLKYGILAAGTHGKTTTTSIIAHLLHTANFDPTIVIGGQFSKGSTGRLGKGDFIVCEADESDGSFIRFNPTIAVLTNIDYDHMDHYQDFDHLKQTFLSFVNKIPFYGCAVLNLDNEPIQSLLPKVEKKIITYGQSSSSDYRFELLAEEKGETTFKLFEHQKDVGIFKINLPGLHNVYNSTAAIATARFLSIDYEVIRQALSSFETVVHRFSILGETKGIIFVDDYAHNPTKIKSVLRAAKKGWNRRIVALFQPHRYSRVQYSYDAFVKAFYDADVLFLTDIYAAGESAIEGITPEYLLQGIKQFGHNNVRYFDRFQLEKEIMKELNPGDMLITLGAGDIWKVGNKIYQSLNNRSTTSP